ncbi:MAG: MarR family winged helix-turn-helix transcriptional regulator [Methylibium sp.]
MDDATRRTQPEPARDVAAPAARNAVAPRTLDQSHLMHLVGYAATRASVTLKKALARHLGPLDLKAVEYSILVIVADNRDVNHKQLCQALDLSAPNLAVIVDRLEQRGLVQRVRGHADRRETFVHLTPAGRALYERATKIAATMEREVTRVLTEAERLLLIELLHKLVRLRPSRRE